MSPALKHNLESVSKDIARNLAQMLEAIKQGDMRQAKAFSHGVTIQLACAACYSGPGTFNMTDEQRQEAVEWFKERFKDL